MSAANKPSVLSANKFANALTVLWDAITAGVGAVVFVLELVIGSVISVVLFLVALIWAIPIVGRLLRQIMGLVQTVVYRVLGLPDMLAWVAGIRPAKKLRLRVIVVHDGTGPVVTSASVLAEVQELIDIFYDKANIRVIPVNPLVFRTAFHTKEQAKPAFAYEMTESPKSILKVAAGLGSYLEDLWIQGFWYELIMARHSLWGNLRRVLGYGAPLVVYAVQDYHDTALGNSLGPLTDYVTVEGPDVADKTTIAHEVGHACGLLHKNPAANFMHAYASNATDMTPGQALWVRNSRHVTYF